ncbi:MAG: sugar ABC transporter substrate-binding protein, partial [Lachnospiraceae bacterium]|nr:sugar ABC transporter substrate-binding protein [Lachnospiraceae bacterium]
MIFNSLSEGKIYLMPSVKAIDQVWVPAQTLMGDIAKDPFRVNNGYLAKYPTIQEVADAIVKVDMDIYDAIYTLAE